MIRTGAKRAWFLFALACVFVSAENALAQSSDTEADESSHKISASYDVLFASKYLFQGLDYSDSRGVAQPNVNVGFGDFTFNAWGNFQPDLDVLNEIDLSVKYTHDFHGFSVAPGYMALRYPNRDWDPSQELFVELGAPGPLHPTLAVHYDFDAGNGSYSTLGVSHAVKGPLGLGANLFYQNQYYEMTGFPAAEIKASAALSIGVLGFTPSLSRFVTWGNGDFKDAAQVPASWLFGVDFAHQLR
jgi:hypothetical protein